MSKKALCLCSAALLLLALSLCFLVPSGAILPEAEWRYQDTMPSEFDDLDEDASLRPYRVLASAAMSDILPADQISALPLDLGTPGNAPKEDNYTENGYRDDSIIVEMESVRQYDCDIHIARIKIATASQLRTAIAGGKFGSNRTLKTSAFAKSFNAVVALNGDFYTQTKAGYIIRQGEVYRQKTSKNMDLLLIDDEGNFHILLRGHDEQAAGVKALMEQHELVNGLFFGPALVVDGAVQEIPEKYQFDPFRPNPRAAIGQLGPLTYAMVVVDGRLDSSPGITIPQMAEFMKSIGCEQAYNLDGGNSAALIFHNGIYSTKSVDNERSVSDIIYFASAAD